AGSPCDATASRGLGRLRGRGGGPPQRGGGAARGPPHRSRGLARDRLQRALPVCRRGTLVADRANQLAALRPEPRATPPLPLPPLPPPLRRPSAGFGPARASGTRIRSRADKRHLRGPLSVVRGGPLTPGPSRPSGKRAPRSSRVSRVPPRRLPALPKSRARKRAAAHARSGRRTSCKSAPHVTNALGDDVLDCRRVPEPASAPRAPRKEDRALGRGARRSDRTSVPARLQPRALISDAI